MKKNKIAFESIFWAAYDIECPFEVGVAFFDYATLESYKQMLNETIVYAHKNKVYKKDHPAPVFVYYTAFRSFLKACFCLQFKSKKWKIKEESDCKSILHQASLTKEEYANPFLVFQKAFAEKTLEEYQYFLCEVVHLALSCNRADFDTDMITPYIHVIKMLDATQLIRDRGIQKRKKKE